MAAQMTSDDDEVFYLGGGMHHGMFDYGSGFCLVNDVVCAARDLVDNARATRVWIIDIDAHKGDGTAALTFDSPEIRTLSVHMAHGWPLDQPRTLSDGRENPSYVASDVDVPISPGEENRYNDRLGTALHSLFAGAGAAPLPPAQGKDVAIVLAGADPWEGDQLPSAMLLKLTRAQMLERNNLVRGFLREKGIPTVYLMAGNYGDKSWRVYVDFLEPILADQTR